MNKPLTWEQMLSFVGQRCRVILDTEHLEQRVGKLVTIETDGSATLIDDEGKPHYMWPVLDIARTELYLTYPFKKGDRIKWKTKRGYATEGAFQEDMGDGRIRILADPGIGLESVSSRLYVKKEKVINVTPFNPPASRDST